MTHLFDHMTHLFDVLHNGFLDVNVQFCDDVDVEVFAGTLDSTTQQL